MITVDRKKQIARNFVAVRKLLDLTAAQIVKRTEGRLLHSEWSKIEHGRAAVTRREKRELLAEGLGLPFEIVVRLAECTISPEEAVKYVRAGNLANAGNMHVPSSDPIEEGERMATLTELSHLKNARFPNLELCLLYHRKNGREWREPAVASARAGIFGDKDVKPEKWERLLDALEEMASHAADSTPPPPLDGQAKKGTRERSS